MKEINGDIPANAWIIAFNSAVEAVEDDSLGSEFYETLINTKNSFIAECQESEISYLHVIRALEIATFITQQTTNSYFDRTYNNEVS